MPDLQDTDCREILRILHQLGDVLWYEDCEEFEDWIILEPSLVLALVREVVYHKYEDATGEDYKELWSNGILPHSLLLRLKLWKCLAGIDMTMVQKFKHLLHHLNLVYPVNDLDKLDEADIIVPMYWKMRGNTNTAHKPLTRQDTLLEENVHDDWYFAKWRYSVPIAISDVLFVNFVVKCYRPYVRCEARDTRFECSVRREFRAAIQLSTNTTGRLDDITIEVAAPSKKFAWAEMRYYVIAMEQVLEKDYWGLCKHAKLKRFIVDDQEIDQDVNNLIGKVGDEARLRQKAPWLPPDFTWFIQCAWRKPEVLDRLHLQHRLEVLKNLVITSQSNSLPSLWTLSYPKMGGLLELRIHSDFSGNCCHKPLKIEVTDNFFATHSDFFQVRLSDCV
ncbi:hypothetical protein PHMEG_00019082 [Phytophthora megakarya]|uniref:Uncharacterized protein n=1 Tax=Phytophthora megakarya TaxID=4795 RepID=A0A225VTY9_9STRA|nr:hypothetical protein PHMEG_00019082 [Phytophthora megakarya]